MAKARRESGGRPSDEGDTVHGPDWFKPAGTSDSHVIDGIKVELSNLYREQHGHGKVLEQILEKLDEIDSEIRGAGQQRGLRTEMELIRDRQKITWQELDAVRKDRKADKSYLMSALVAAVLSLIGALWSLLKDLTTR